jgi:prefoldin subunit 5
LNQDKNRKQWLEVESAAERLKNGVNELEKENVALQTKLKHAR